MKLEIIFASTLLPRRPSHAPVRFCHIPPSACHAVEFKTDISMRSLIYLHISWAQQSLKKYWIAIRAGYKESTASPFKGTPLVTSYDINFWPTDSKAVLIAPSTPICTNFEGQCAPKKTHFWSKSSKQRPTT